MKKFLLVPVLVSALIGLGSCGGWVQSNEQPRDIVADAQLDVVSQVNFSIVGVQRGFSLAYGSAVVQGGGLSDELIFDSRVPNATFPTYQLIDQGTPQLDNNSVTTFFAQIGNYRFLADTLISRMFRIRAAFPTTAADTVAIINNGLYNAYLHAGIARHLYATYIGIDARRGGGVIARSAFIPTGAMHDSALVMLNRALPLATPANARVVNSIIARIHLYEGRFAQAAAAAALGLRSGDAPLRAVYNAQTITTHWFNEGGRGRAQFVPDPRFARYIAADPREGRIFPGAVVGSSVAPTGGVGDAELTAALTANNRLVLIGPIVRSPTFTFHLQSNYPNQDSPQSFITWQENSLMLAETALRNGNDEAAALTNLNNVRRFYNLDTRTTTNLDSIYIERDKTLFGMGQRLPDQRRFNRWHLGAGTWQWLPITLPERNTNPNLGS